MPVGIGIGKHHLAIMAHLEHLGHGGPEVGHICGHALCLAAQRPVPLDLSPEGVITFGDDSIFDQLAKGLVSLKVEGLFAG